ncbi:putative sulfate exporter family transporter [Bacillus siamensis]|uniref:YeiH family protein n=1 Tax=Bacillus siamensis TaxID=659243 RepID=UPI002DBEF9F1|nr:putative sulfate exporter family transporter [Bacillus siamensis]MEC3654567.1 putative sulfate exporter family transporter [Bacillus siamensis]
MKIVKGVSVTAGIAFAAFYASRLPFLNLLGMLVLAMLIGMVWRAVFGQQAALEPGIRFSSKYLLKAGIILLGMRLNLTDIYHAGWHVFAIAVCCMMVAGAVVYGLSRLFRIDQTLSMLTACGTAICGAAAIAAIAPQIRSNENATAISAAAVSLLGTVFTVVYSLSYHVLGFSPAAYGVFCGATLHEVAHAAAAGIAGGKAAVEMAVIVKLTRVTLLVPVAFMLGMRARRGGKSETVSAASLPIPWFIFGFLGMSAIHTSGIISAAHSAFLVQVSYVLIGMAMAGLGLNVHISAFRHNGWRALEAGLIGSLCLSLFGWAAVAFFL